VLSLILSLALVAASPYVAPGLYQAPHRFPDELMADPDVPDWAKVVWCAVRKVQANNDRAWGEAAYYADLCAKSPAQVRNGIALLRRGGWLVEVGRRGRSPELRCYAPALSPDEAEAVERNEGLREPAPDVQTLIADRAPEAQTLIARDDGSATGDCAECNEGLHTPTPPNKEQACQEAGMGDDAARARAREALAAWSISKPAVVAEAEDRAEAGRPDAQLVRNALRLGLTGRPPVAVADALDALDAPAAAALAVATLRTARSKSPDGRARYLLSLAASLQSHDTERRYADAHPGPAADPAEGGGRGPVGRAGAEAGGPDGPGEGVGPRRALAVRGAGGDDRRLSAAERRGQFGPQRGAELLAATRRLREQREGDGGAGDGPGR